MAQPNYYEVLGVSETATQDEIKKAYRKKAVEHHPDKGGDENIFKEVAQAYDTIGDDNKRKQYDNQRNNPMAGFGGGGGSMEDLFAQFFGGGRGGNPQQQQRQAPDKVVDVNISVLDSYKSTQKNIVYSRKHQCQDCSGSGGERIQCGMCGGAGSITQRVGTGMFVQMVRTACNGCGGRGFTFKTTCHSCVGSGTKDMMDSINVAIPHGIDNGQFIRAQGKGDFTNGSYGNLLIKFNVQPLEDFEKVNNDLIYNKFFNLDELKSDSFEIPHPDGKLAIKMPDEFDTTKPLRLKSKGFRNNGLGDMYVRLNVRFKK